MVPAASVFASPISFNSGNSVFFVPVKNSVTVSPTPDKTLDGKTFNQLTMMFHENNPYVTDDIRNQLVAATVTIDDKYKKKIVTENGVNYIKIGDKFYPLPDQTGEE